MACAPWEDFHLLVVHVAIDNNAPEFGQLLRQALPREIELVIAEADVVDLSHVQTLQHRLSAIDRRQHTGGQEVSIQR